MARGHKKSQGDGYVTHRSRGRFTLKSPMNMRLDSTSEFLGNTRAQSKRTSGFPRPTRIVKPKKKKKAPPLREPLAEYVLTSCGQGEPWRLVHSSEIEKQ